MAIIGPVVKNDIFFFITILALAAAMMLLEWRKRRAPKTEGLEGAALRKAKWTARRERLWMTASCIASCLFILLITAEFIYARAGDRPLRSDPGDVRKRRRPDLHRGFPMAISTASSSTIRACTCASS